jgi:hypothetical protein
MDNRRDMKLERGPKTGMDYRRNRLLERVLQAVKTIQ